MYRVPARNAPRMASSTPSRTMFTSPFFPHLGGGPMGAFSNDLFRLLDSAADLVPESSRHAGRNTFTPRFDVREAGANYELQGELPGFEQENLDIEFIDDHTLVVKGKIAHENTHSNVPALEGADQKTIAADDQAGSEKGPNYRKASVEEEYVDAGEQGKTPTSATTGEATKPTEEGKPAEESKSSTPEPAFKYWVSERSAGEFERHFSFPGRVNQDEVKASLKNGILSIVVPKIAEHGSRKIAIQGE